jgi:alpha-N-acetylglucosaminidase
MQAWQLLGETVYAAAPSQHYEHHMAYCPTAIIGGSSWDTPHGSEHPSWYQPETLYAAWGLLIEAGKSECASPLSQAFIFDLVDVGREVLSIQPCNEAQLTLRSANTTAGLAAANATMTELMSDIDRLLGASDGFLLGKWVGDARALATAASGGDDTAAASFLEWNARSQVTTWTPSMACDGKATSLPSLYDYGNKEWSGLVRGYYDKRYQIFADSRLCQLTESSDPRCHTGLSFNAKLMQLACEFQHSNEMLPAAAVGDALSISEELYKKYARPK